jgi:hypothetical protein
VDVMGVSHKRDIDDVRESPALIFQQQNPHCRWATSPKLFPITVDLSWGRSSRQGASRR